MHQNIYIYLGKDGKMRLSLLTGLVLVLLCCTAATQAAISFRLHSKDFAPPANAKTPPQDYALANSASAVCVLLALDNGLGGVVRFTYSSNLTDVRQRADVLVSIHKPSPSAPSVAVLDAAENVVDAKVYSAAQLHRLNVEANVVRRSKERHGNADITAEEESARSSTVAVRPVQEGTGPGAHFLDGNYAACFLLLRPPTTDGRKEPLVHEEVQLRLLEVASTSHSTSTYIARLSNPIVDAAGNEKGTDMLTNEADREYAKMIRTLFRANKNADLQKLLDGNAVVTSAEMKQQLDALKAVQTQLFSLYTNSEHLEERYLRMRSTAETTFTRIWICMIATVLAMGSTIWLTFHFTKDIIVKKKLI